MGIPCVVFGGPSPEHDISILTGLQAARALVDTGVDCLALHWSKTGEWHAVDPRAEAADFLEGVPRKARPVSLHAVPGGGFVERKRRLDVSVVVNCCHGGPGEDGTLQAVLDLAGLAATGPGVAGAQLAMDKLAFGALAAYLGLRTLPRVLVADGADPPPFPAPMVIKPRFGGSSIGVEVVEDLDTALTLARTSPHYRDGAVVEPYLVGSRDLNVAVRTWPELALSAIEEPARDAAAAVYTYAKKYVEGGGLERSARTVPAEIPEAVEAAIRRDAETVARAAGVRSVARLDFLLAGDDLYVNEVNSIPGALAHYLWVDPPATLAQLVASMIEEAEAGGPRRFVTAGADGVALRAAGSIAGKLL